MTNDTDRTNSISFFVAYYIVLAAIAAASFFPQYRVWSFHHFGFLSPLAMYITLGIAALLPIGAMKIRFSLDDESTFGSKYLIGLGLFWAALLIVFRTRGHFLGDGYSLVTSLNESDGVIKMREIGEVLAHVGVRSVLEGITDTPGLMSYQLISIASGLIMLGIVFYYTRKLIVGRWLQLLFVIGLLSSGWSLLYFGYVENYSLFVTAVLWFVLQGLSIVHSDTPRWTIVIPLAVAVFLHILGVTLIPATIFLLILHGHLRSKLRRSILIVIGLIGLAAATYFYFTNMFVRFALLPIVPNEITVEGYTLFSLKHLLDYLNLLLLFAPGLPLILILARNEKGRFNRSEFYYFVFLTLSALVAAFIFDPKIGMPRDWDLFAFVGPTLSVPLFYWLLKEDRRKRLVTASVLVILLGVTNLAARVAVLNDVDRSVRQVKYYFRLDHTKNRNGGVAIVAWFADQGDKTRGLSERVWRREQYPQVDMLERAGQLIEEEQYDQAQAILEDIVKTDPLFWNAWTSLASCYLTKNRLDDAERALEISYGLNPFRAEVHSQMAYVYKKRNQFDKAEEEWLKAYEMDSTYYTALSGLYNLYLKSRRVAEGQHFLKLAASHPEADARTITNLANMYSSQRNFRTAIPLYRKALKMGLDPAFIDTAMTAFPGLAEAFKKTPQ